MNSRTLSQELMTQVLSRARPGILTDIDGTISRIAPTPESAVVEPAARAALQLLSETLALTGAITGRSALDARQMVGLDELVYSGNHGMELWRDGKLEQSPLALRYQPTINAVLDQLKSPGQFDGIFVENKVLTASIHYRAVTDADNAEASILEELEHLIPSGELVVTRGRKVIEIRPPVELSKGTSVAELADEYRLDGLIYLGDDVTDVDAFHALSRMREELDIACFSIGVRNDPTPPEVIESADALVEGVDGVIELLQQATGLGS